MLIGGWGRYPQIEAEVLSPLTSSEFLQLKDRESDLPGIPRGLGRSYGDSSLAARMISTRHLNRYKSFDSKTGLLTCEAGVSIADILDTFVPKGWFPKVTPGTKYVSVGGAIASDVHGKNHHSVGSFCDHVQSLRLLVASGEVLICSKSKNKALFQATCGGMGLTGIILDATIALQKIQSSFVDEVTYKAENLQECFDLFDEHGAADYSVAWIDCLKQGESLGRSLVMTGQHSLDGQFDEQKGSAPSIPCNLPSGVLNRYSVGLFNKLYYGRIRSQKQERQVHFNPYFYPLDGIENWTRLYGSKGFVQYQFVIPKEAGVSGMTHILAKIARSGAGSFLSVLKAFGEGNDNYLSFPLEGYTLALDFKVNQNTLTLLDELDPIVHDYGGRVYLTKDARMSEETFKKGYPNWEKFQAVRKKFDAKGVFSSLQSRRLGLDE